MSPRIQRRARPPAAEWLDAPLPGLLKSIYASRGVRHVNELSRELADLLPASTLGGAKEAADLLASALAGAKRVLVVGDFDCDGATSSALAVLALRAMGCASVDYLVPNRFEYGYGLTPEIVALAATRSPDLIVTVDNGISSIAGVAAAKALGIQVIITDHHLPGEHLPDADVIVNPNATGNAFPGKATAGVGVIFYVLVALRARLNALGWFERMGIRPPNLADYLDLVALGTVADVVTLDTNNRILVHQGLARIRAGRCRPGISALFQVAGRHQGRAQAQDLGFFIGPRLNAAGRLDDMSIGIECLLAEDAKTALGLAHELDRLNRERRDIEDGMKDQAGLLLGELELAADGELPWGLCLYDPGWHEGVIGILASRIKERHHRPTILFANAGDGQLKGSGRSIPGFHLRDALAEIAANHPDLIEKFGGHAMAAGLGIKPESLPEFVKQFDMLARRYLDEGSLQAVLYSDGEIAVNDLSLDMARLIQASGPWGQGFPEPLFDGCFEVVSQRLLKDKHWKLVVRPEGSSITLDAIGFNLADEHPAPLPTKIRLAYRLDENTWQDKTSLQLGIEHMEAT